MRKNKAVSVSDITFNTCDELSVVEKTKLVQKYSELMTQLETITTYPNGKIAEEKKQAVEDLIMQEISKNPELMYISQYDSLRNVTYTLARACIKAKCNTAVAYMLQDKIAPTLQDHFGQNLGMHCAIDGTEDLVLLALDNPEASTQQSNTKMNIGMMAASRGLVQATLKALTNPTASTQQNLNGDNIGMISARIMMGNEKMKPCFECAATNKEAILQRNNNDQNMFYIAEESGYSSRQLRDKFGGIYLDAIHERDFFNQ